MADFFKSSGADASSSDGIVISTPGSGATVTGSVHLMASASESQPVRETQVWDNGVKLGAYGDQIDAIYNLSPGQHTTTVLDLDSSYRVIHQSSVTYNVQPLSNGLQVISPVSDEIIRASTVHIVAQANEAVPVSQMQVWDNGVKLGWYPGASVNQYFNLAPGSHIVTVLDLDDHSNVLHESRVAYSVQ